VVAKLSTTSDPATTAKRARPSARGSAQHRWPSYVARRTTHACLDSGVDVREFAAELVTRMALDQAVRTSSDPRVAQRMGEVDADNTSLAEDHPAAAWTASAERGRNCGGRGCVATGAAR
jgi:hypothetical protein